MRISRAVTPSTLWLLALSLLSFTCGKADLASSLSEERYPARGVNVQQNRDLPSGLPEVPEQNYFDFSNEVRVQLMLQLSKTAFRGVAIRAPEKIYLEDHSDLPVILFSQRTGLRDWEVSFLRNSTLVAVDLATGRIFHGHAFSSPKKRDFADADLSMQGARPNDQEAESISSGVDKLDARVLLSLPWQATRYALTVITHDWVSNTAVIELASKNESSRRLAYFPFDRAVQLGETARTARQTDKLPNFDRTQKSPVLKDPGVKIVLPSRADVSSKTLPIYGAVRLPVPFGSIVEMPTLAGDTARTPTYPTVVLTGSLLLVQKDVTNRARVEIQIPVFTSESPEEGDVVDGYFGIDLATLLPTPLSEANYFLYFVMGQYVDGPHETIVSRQ